jgi:hypothetical protein
MFSICVQNVSFTYGDYKELSLSKEFDLKIEVETLDTWISLNTYPNDMKFLSHIYSFMIYKVTKLQIKKCSNKGDMTKNKILHRVFKSS